MSTSSVHTMDSVMRAAAALTPMTAISGLTVNAARCATNVYEGKILDEQGKEYTLRRIDGRYSAGYLRVSTILQKVHGFSMDDQARRQVKRFMQDGHAFRLFSDAELEGALPYSDTSLLTKLRETKLRNYTKVFNAVFLNESSVLDYTSEQRKSVEKFLERRLVEIKREYPISTDDLKYKIKKNAKFRPGLTELMRSLGDIHQVAVNDLSRLSRNEALFAAIVEEFERYETDIIGINESLVHIGQDDLASELTTSFLAKIAQFKLREVQMGAFRGILESLIQGKTRGRLPAWLVRDKDGKTTMRTDCDWPHIIKTAVGWYVDDRVTAHGVVAKLNTEHPLPSGRAWTAETVGNLLFTKGIVGIEQEFGLEFPILPQIVSLERWHQIQVVRASVDTNKYKLRYALPGTVVSPVGHTKYLATGLLRCNCHGSINQNRGGAIVRKPSPSLPQKESYVCGSTRRKLDMRHISLNAANVDQFLSDLVTTMPEMLLSAFSDTRDYKDIQTALNDVEQEIIKHKAAMAVQRTEAAITADTLAKTTVMSPASPAYAMLREAFLTDLMSGPQDQLQCLQRQADDLRSTLTAYVPPDFTSDLTARMARWNELSVDERNKLILMIFDHFQFEVINGDDHNLICHMVLRGGIELPHVQMICSKPPQSGVTRITRRFPSAASYKLSVIEQGAGMQTGTPDTAVPLV